MDLGFQDSMSARENFEAAKQLTEIFAENRQHRTPFVLHFANFTEQNHLAHLLQQMMPNIRDLPLILNSNDYVDQFPKEKLVILTPDSPHNLDKFNPNDHYVINAIVDRGDKVPLSMAKAKRYNLRTARLPLDKYRSVRLNNRLTLNQIFLVMLEMKTSQNWDKAFNYIAPRKFK